MLDLLAKSKIRQKMVLLYVYNPDKAHYINEVARLVKTSAGTAQRELEKLVKSGLLAKEKKANLTYYKLNSSNPLLGDLKNIIDKTIGLEYILQQELGAAVGIDYAFLFGSYVKGDFKPDSDIDIYIVGEIREDTLYKKIKKAEEKVCRAINYHLAAKEEFKKNLKKSFFHKEILSRYILLVGDGHEFKKFIG